MARMNSGIILAGQTPDYLGTIDRANTAAARQNQFQQQNALADVYKQHGQGIAQGDQNAMNALAGVDPMAALGVQKQRLGMDATRQGMQINQQELALRKQDAARKTQVWAAQQDAATLQAQRDRIATGLASTFPAYQSGDQAALDAAMTAIGQQPVPISQWPALAAQYKGAQDSIEAQLKMQPAAPKPLSGAGKMAADLNAGLITPEQYNAANQKSGLRITTGPDGSTTFEQGVGVTGGPRTAGETSLDKETAKELSAFIQGGASDMSKNISQLKSVRGRIAGGANVSGPFMGMVPDSVMAAANPDAVDLREQVEEVVQRNLRVVLGAQFTEKEGERLIKRAFNPNLDEARNLERLDRLISQIELAYQAKAAAAEYFRENGTLTGWEGRLPTVSDFDSIPQDEPRQGNEKTNEAQSITDDAGYNALPSGALFIAPDGTQRRKP